jgi:hypothetical protein
VEDCSVFWFPLSVLSMTMVSSDHHGMLSLSLLQVCQPAQPNSYVKKRTLVTNYYRRKKMEKVMNNILTVKNGSAIGINLIRHQSFEIDRDSSVLIKQVV